MAAICNIVLVGKLKGVNFSKVLAEYKPSQIRRQKFTGVTIPLPESTCLLFPNGSITIVGVKSMCAINSLPMHLSCILPEGVLDTAGENCHLDYIPGLRVCNIVASFSVGRKIAINSLYNSLKSTTRLTYTPETFPGMTIRLEGSLVAIVFHSGKIIITGAKSPTEITIGQMKVTHMITPPSN